MAINLGVKALLAWVNSIKLSNREITIHDLHDGTVLLKVVYMLKKEPNPCFDNSVEDRFSHIADFVERDCRFNASKGCSLSWNKIRDGTNLTIEIAKVLLLLVYHDMMNDRCTLNMLDCDVEREIANLTGSFVMESEGCVYLSKGLDAYLARKYLPVSHEHFERSPTTSSSSTSTFSSVSDDESPLIHCTKKITFVDMQTVASSSVRSSPLQDIMNTPKFQLRKMKRQMIKERDYRDSLEKELASKLAVIAERESQINQLQYRLDKVKEEQGNQEHFTREQINELELKNNTLQMRLSELSKHNKDLKSTSSLMERKMDDLTEENGVLSSQMRAVRSQLATFEAEVIQLTNTQASAQEEWGSKVSHLQSELNQATAQKELLTEQILILQGKISCLEDEINKVTKEEVGENMGPVMEREMFETEINSLKNELESTFSTLKKAEVEIVAKSQQLAEYQQKISQQNELLEQQKLECQELLQAKEDIFEKLQMEITEQRAHYQQEIQHLKSQLEQAEQQKIEQMTRLQQHIAACEQEIEKLKKVKDEKEDLLHQTEEKVKVLETKLVAVNCVLADKDQQIKSLSEEVSCLSDETRKNKDEIKAKEQLLAKFLLEKSNDEEILFNRIQSLTTQVNDLSSSLKEAEEKIQCDKELLNKSQEENMQQREKLQHQIVTYEQEVQNLNSEIHEKNEQLVKIKNDSSLESELLKQEINCLKAQLKSLNDSFVKTKEQFHAQQSLLTKQEQESASKIELLNQQLSASEERLREMSKEITTKKDELNMLQNHSLEQAKLLHNEIQDLKKEVHCLNSSLSSAEENLQTKEKLFAEQQLQSNQQIEMIQLQMVASQDEVKRLNAEIHAKVEQFIQLKAETSKHSELLQQEINDLNKQMESMTNSLQMAKDQVQEKEDLMAKKEQESTSQIVELKNHGASLEEKINQLKEEIQTKESELAVLKVESSKDSEVLQNQVQALKDQMQSLSESLKTATEQVQAKEILLTQKELEISNESEIFKIKMTASEEELKGLKQQIQIKEEQLTTVRNESSMKSEALQQEIISLQNELNKLSSVNAELNQNKAAAALKLQQIQQELEASTLKEKEALDEKEVLIARVVQAEKDHKNLEKEVTALICEKERLTQAKQALERENMASCKLKSVLELELENLKKENKKLFKQSESAEATAVLMKDLQEQLSAKSEAADQYKAQMEKAVTYYTEKKNLLQKSQEEIMQIKHSLEIKEREIKTMTLENKTLQLDLDRAQTKEKTLMKTVASLEAQLAFADRSLRAQNKIHGRERSESFYLEVPNKQACVETKTHLKKASSSDGLEHSSLEDSLNSTRKLSAPDESSTPLVRSSERLAAKRRALQAESLETLYFTPINTKAISRTNAEDKLELGSALKNPTSSVKRRRTTQVINITMTKKTPGGGEDDETFYSLASARSQPNLASARPTSVGLFDTPTGAASDQLIGLPGYRRSTIHSQTTSTFCVGAENEPDGAPEDWMRIAELQARNKACLPHLKSSYPVESETGRGGAFIFTDEELRTGDPSDTIRRASMMPGQFQDSLVSHQHSLMLGKTGTAAHRLSLMPGQLPSKALSSAQLRGLSGTKRASSVLSVHQTSPEKKVKASCFPRPLTPKNKNVNSGTSSSQLQPVLSPANRRESMMFTIENTPKKGNYLKKRLDKLRSSTRKSPGKISKKSPAQTTTRKGQANMSSGSSRIGMGWTGSFKSPQVSTKGQRKTGQATSRSGKSPGLTASARKIMRKINV